MFDEISKSGCPTVSFADGFRLLQNNTFSRDDLSYDVGDVRNIHYGDVLIKYGTVTEYSARDCAARPLKLSIHSGGIEHACRRR